MYSKVLGRVSAVYCTGERIPLKLKEIKRVTAPILKPPWSHRIWVSD
jgi:hypothetical protein